MASADLERLNITVRITEVDDGTYGLHIVSFDPLALAAEPHRLTWRAEGYDSADVARERAETVVTSHLREFFNRP